MQNVAPREDLVLVSSRKIFEAADLADFAKSRSLGEVIVESDTERAQVLLSENHFSFAFIGLPDTERRGTLLSALAAGHTHIVLVDDNGAIPGSPGLRVLSRPFTDSDLEGAIRGNDGTSACVHTASQTSPAA
ncbi:hypothetical protein XM53_09185 [Roseovarius atlanticus]|uniref:Uncharacterized protein n=1 Tax=Roseovarius atlanticus TaxID=1641875 RepID=A0A0T5NV03_9RHOB|nr:hypothetical protein [Roseovarius atlanticus]KRS12749.1 hypothetical protein XM53_09185 [Roseovarius atlanticus]